jgi:hypothetical protein
MYVAIRGKPGLQSMQNGGGGCVVNVVEKAVDQDEIVARSGGLIVGADVGHNELTMVLIAGVSDIAGVDVDAKIVCMGEKRGVGARATTNVQHATDAIERIVGEEGRQFGRDKRSLPQAVDESAFEEMVEDPHGH